MIKRFKYSPLDKELKAQTDIAKKKYQNYSKSDLIYNSNYSFSKYYRDSKKIDNLSLESKYLFLPNFFII